MVKVHLSFDQFATFRDKWFSLDSDLLLIVKIVFFFFSSLSNVFLSIHLSVTGGSKYLGSLWVVSNTDDRELLLLDWMSG